MALLSESGHIEAQEPRPLPEVQQIATPVENKVHNFYYHKVIPANPPRPNKAIKKALNPATVAKKPVDLLDNIL